MPKYKDKKYTYITISKEERLALKTLIEDSYTQNNFNVTEGAKVAKNLLKRSKHTKSSDIKL